MPVRYGSIAGYRERSTMAPSLTRNGGGFEREASAALLQAEPLAPVVALGDGVTPGAIVQEPLDGAPDPLLERHRGLPPELPLDLRGVDRVAAVVPGPILHEGDLIAVRPVLGAELVQHGADRLHDLEVRALGVAAHAVHLARLPRLGGHGERARVIAHPEPVADVLAVA